MCERGEAVSVAGETDLQFQPSSYTTRTGHGAARQSPQTSE